MLCAIGDSFTFGDELHDREKQAWPFLLSKSVTNLGKSNSSNDRIFRIAIEESLEKKHDLIIVSWSWPERFETFYKGSPQDWNSHQAKSFPWLKTYYSEFFDLDFSYGKTFLQMITLQNHFKLLNQKYIFCNVRGLQDDYEKYKQKYSTFLKNIDPTFFVGWPTDGFLQFQGNCAKGRKGHPLETGHIRIAQKLREHIIKLNWEYML